MTTEPSPAAGETIGQRLKRLRLERSLSQRELASPGVSYAYISRIEAGTRQPSVKALRRLAAKLGVSAEYLETGSMLDEAEQRELRLADLELAVRLGEGEGVEDQLDDALRDALASGDTASALRARVALAALASQRGDHRRAAEVLEAAIAVDPPSPLDRLDIYSSLGRAYAASGRPERAVELFETCLAEAASSEARDPTLETRYATLLSYALSDTGDLVRAEQVVKDALERAADTEDPYMRVRLYWALSRLEHGEGKGSAALAHARKAIALLEATEDSLHLARAHMLAAGITIGRSDPGESEKHLDLAERLLGPRPAVDDVVDIKVRRARVASLRGEGEPAVRLAQEAIDLLGEGRPAYEGSARFALAEALAQSGDVEGANDAFRRAVELLEGQRQWREAAQAARAWGRALRQWGRETEALDVLEHATELGLRASPAEAHTEH